MRLAAVSRAALSLGLSPGMSLADARARAPELNAVPHDAGADAALLAQAVQAFGRFSPMVARDPPDGLMLDVTGCAHLFGGEPGLVTAARALADQAGLDARLALARTPQTARALARFGAGGVVPEGRDREAVRPLPIVALELNPADALALRRAGLKTLGDLDDRPRAPLAARFGAGFPHRLDLILGLADARITPVRPAPPIVADRILAEPLLDTEPVQAVIADLLEEMQQALEARGLGARLFILTVYRVDGARRRIGLGVRSPLRDAAGLLRLFRERLAALPAPLDPGFGFDQLRIEARALRPLAAEQPDLDAPARPLADLDVLIDRLTARLGPEAVAAARPLGSHLPERAEAWVSAANSGDRPAEIDWLEPEPGAPPTRPLHLFDPPQPVEALALAPDSPPAMFHWRRVRHRIVRAEGPERIESEWWRRRERVRDYYRVEDDQGRRFWLFRAGHFGGDPPPRWYLHGLFA